MQAIKSKEASKEDGGNMHRDNETADHESADDDVALSTDAADDGSLHA